MTNDLKIAIYSLQVRYSVKMVQISKLFIFFNITGNYVIKTMNGMKLLTFT